MMNRIFGAFARLISVAALLASPSLFGEQVIFSEIHYNAKVGEPDFLEITNNTATPLDMGEWYFSDGIIYTFPDFDPGDTSAHILKHFETILVSPVDEATLRQAYPGIPETTRIFGPYEGALANSGETVTLNDKNGVVLTTVDYNDGGKWPAAADGTGHTLIRINPNRTNAGWRNWKASRLPGGTPGVTPASADGPPTFSRQLTETTSTWKYDQNEANLDRGTAWREREFDDSSWSEGPGLFGKNSFDSFPTPWSTGGRITYYLRQEFQLDEPFVSATMDIECQVDDGVVFYLNGQEVSRFNMPAGEITFETPASSGREWNELAEVVVGADISSALRPGSNVLAVEVHNASSGSNDIAFGANISITAVEPPANPLPDLVISEVHFDSEGIVDWVELHAPGNSPVSVNALSLANTRSLIDPVALSGSIPAGGYQSFPVTLPLDENGDLDLFLIQGQKVIDAARLDRDFGEEGFQSFPVGQEWFGGMGHTRDAPNAPGARQTAIVINEIMYDTPSDQGSADFIELYNRGSESVDLSGWEITDGVRFEFPPGTVLPAQGYLVVAADASFIRRVHGNIRVVGNWRRNLSDRGELLRIEDRFGNLVDEVDYAPEGDWPNFADGDGSSMELRHPSMNNDFATAWADSDETGKSTMQTFTYTADFRRAPWMPVTSGQELHAHLVGDAHVILENISVKLNNAGDNLLRNPGVMSPTSSSAQGWVSQGTHYQSFFDGSEFNLISTGHGDNKANRAEVDFATSPAVGNSYTLSFDARWIYGKSRLIFQTLDHAYGTTFLLPIPENLGTPGAPNSALIESPAPTVAGVIHGPAVPAASEQVTVSAQVESVLPNPLVELVYRLDTNSGDGPWLRKAMSDDGTGLFSTRVSDFTNQGDITQFYVEASVGGASTAQPRYGARRPAMWIVDDRDMPDILLQNRFVVSAHSQRALNTSIGGGAEFDYNFPRMSNQYFNATFIANESEIYYNAEIRKSGSPFTRATDGNLDHGKWKLPGDRLFRGRARNVIDASGTPQGSGTPRFYDDRMGRYMLYQLGHPINEMEFTHTVINATGFDLRENHEPISNDFLRRNFPDGTKGTLLRIDDEWRFTGDDGNARSSRNADWSYKDTENPIVYHSEWLMRTREADYDYGSFIEFTRLLDQNRLEPEILNRMSNSEMLALNAAVRGYNGDWDTLTMNRGKNAYFYRPKNDGGWMLIHWDGDRVFDGSNRPFLGGLPGVGKYFNRPFVRRQMNYYLLELLEEHTRGSARTEAWMDAEIAAIQDSGVNMTKSHYLNWFNARESSARDFIGSTNANTAFAVTSSNNTTSENLISLTGTAPPSIFAVRIAGQFGTTLDWADRTDWELSGIVLAEGANSLTVEGLDHEGNVVDQVPFNITKTGNAPPVISLDTVPDSLTVPVGQNFVVTAAGSYDPEGGVVNLEWSTLPTSGVEFISAEGTFSGVFTQPGFYLVNARGSDPEGNITNQTLGVSVHFDHRFASFGGQSLDSAWSPFKVEQHGNSSSGSHYTLEDRDGRLTLTIPLSHRSIALPEPVLPDPVNYIDFGSTWKYDDSNQELTGTFAQPGFDDSTWQSGAGFLGFNQTGLPAPGLQTEPLQRDRANDLVTYYFRKEFEFTDDPIGARLLIDHIVDDGVRYYLNGQVLGSVRLPDGPIDSKTGAETLREENVIEEDILVLDVSAAIVNGTNVFAAEVHNSSAGSSDLVFGARVDIAANPVQQGTPDLDEVPHPWLTRPLPAGDWILETKVTLEKSQFGEFYTGLLVEADQNGNAFRYGVGFKDGDSIAAFRVNPSGTVETLSDVPSPGQNKATIRLQRQGNLLKFEERKNGVYTLVHQQTLPEGTTFSIGGIFASTEMEQSLETSFSYAVLIDSNSDFSDWLAANGLFSPDAEFQNSGMTNLMAYALGRDLNPGVSPVIVNEDGMIGFSHRQRVIGGQISYRVERSTDLASWEPAGDLSPFGAPVENPDGTFTVNLLSDLLPSENEEVYYRLVVSLF